MHTALPKRVATKEVARLLQGLQISLRERGVRPENMRVQLERELFESLDVPPQKLIQWAKQKLGLKVILLDMPETARQYYLGSVGSTKTSNQKNLVITSEPNQTFLTFGQDLTVEPEFSKLGQIAYGTQSFLLNDPFDIIDVALARNEVHGRFKELIPASLRDQAVARYIYVSHKPEDDLLARLDLERRRGGLSVLATGLNRLLLQWYLSQTGLTYLRQCIQTDSTIRSQAECLVKRLIVLAEVYKALDIAQAKYGLNDGSTRVVFDELAKSQIDRHAQQYGRQLFESYQTQFEQVQKTFQTLFSDFQIRGRVKTLPSIVDKLTRKASRSEGMLYPMRDSLEAQEMVSDGLGFCLLLNSSQESSITQVRQSLIQAIESEQLQILELKNYRAKHPEALPYFKADDVAAIRQAAEAQPLHPKLQILDGKKAEKETGYTTLQLVLVLKNQETGLFDGPLCELQIRGKTVDALYSIEHWIRDVRLGKTIAYNYLKNLKPLLKTVSAFDELQYQCFLLYLNRFYNYCRQLECGQRVEMPSMPSELPLLCNLSPLLKLPI